MPERLRAPEISDAGDQALVEEGITHLAPAVSEAQVGDHPVEIRRLAEDVRPEPPERPPVQLEHPPAVEHRLPVCAAQDEPGTAAHGPPARAHTPAAGHAQVVSEHVAAL